jgi:hypothetical protein
LFFPALWKTLSLVFSPSRFAVLCSGYYYEEAEQDAPKVFALLMVTAASVCPPIITDQPRSHFGQMLFVARAQLAKPPCSRRQLPLPSTPTRDSDDYDAHQPPLGIGSQHLVTEQVESLST